MKKSAYGFTIVELLVVIVVIGILAAITVVAFNGVQERAHNTARYHELKAWQKQYELYKAMFGNYPVMAAGGYCLGYGFPVGSDNVARCRDYWQSGSATSYLESNNTALMTELKKVGSLPAGPRVGIDSTVGPYVNYDTYNNIILRMVVNGSNASACPSGTTLDYTDGSKYAICYIMLTL